jgi:hypothetical protein
MLAPNQVFAVRKRKRPQKHAIDHAEYRGVGADGDGQSTERNEGETCIALHQPKSVLDVLNRGMHECASRCGNRSAASQRNDA